MGTSRTIGAVRRELQQQKTVINGNDSYKTDIFGNIVFDNNLPFSELFHFFNNQDTDSINEPCRGKSGETLLILAIQQKQLLAVIIKLLDYGADPRVKDNNSHNAFYYLSQVNDFYELNTKTGKPKEISWKEEVWNEFRRLFPSGQLVEKLFSPLKENSHADRLLFSRTTNTSSGDKESKKNGESPLKEESVEVSGYQSVMEDYSSDRVTLDLESLEEGDRGLLKDSYGVEAGDQYEEERKKIILKPIEPSSTSCCSKQTCCAFTIFAGGSGCAVFLWASGHAAACVVSFMGVVVVLAIAIPLLVGYGCCRFFSTKNDGVTGPPSSNNFPISLNP